MARGSKLPLRLGVVAGQDQARLGVADPRRLVAEPVRDPHRLEAPAPVLLGAGHVPMHQEKDTVGVVGLVEARHRGLHLGADLAALALHQEIMRMMLPPHEGVRPAVPQVRQHRADFLAAGVALRREMLEPAVAREARDIAVGVAGVERPAVHREQLLDVEALLDGEAGLRGGSAVMTRPLGSAAD